MRGWHVQQLAKLAVAQIASEEILIHADSDIALVRPFREEALTDADGSVRLFSIPDAVDDRLPEHVQWQRTAEHLLGLPPRPLPLPDYIGGLIPWRRDIALSLLEHIERQSGRHWMTTLARAPRLSEYILYGRFVDDVLPGTNGRPGASLSLCRCYWGSDPLTNPELESFIAETAEHEVGVMVSAKAHMDPAQYGSVFERLWSQRAEPRDVKVAPPSQTSDS
jgi:hypothetical protein